jgi:SAM-dependent methyltransferase
MKIDLKLFTEKEIIETYKKYVVKDAEYFKKSDKRYKSLSEAQKQKVVCHDFPRIAALFDFEDWIEKYNLKEVNSLLSTSKTDIELEYIKTDHIEFYEYSEGDINDLHTLNINKKDFDFVIFNQTLEHLYNPFISMKNLYDHLKPGGYLYTTVPTVNMPHMLPFHYWGVTPLGLCMLSKSVGFDICECGQWGGYSYLGYIFTYGEWPSHDVVFNPNGIIENSELCQAQTWILVQKPI